jgi:hypothetical protein
VFGGGLSVRDDVFVADLAELLVEAALRRATGSYHAAGERARSVLEVAESCCVAAAAITGGAPLTPLVVQERAPKWWLDQEFELAPTRRAFGYAPTPLLEGLRAEAEWLHAGAPGDAPRFVLSIGDIFKRTSETAPRCSAPVRNRGLGGQAPIGAPRVARTHAQLREWTAPEGACPPRPAVHCRLDEQPGVSRSDPCSSMNAGA